MIYCFSNILFLIHQKQTQSIWYHQNLLYKQVKIPECCNRVKVGGVGNSVKELKPELFTTYTKEKDPMNGNVTYTSQSGTIAIAVEPMNHWILQHAEFR